MGKREPTFSLDEFSSWLKEQKDEVSMQLKKQEKNTLLDKVVESRLGMEHLKQKIKEHNNVRKIDVLAEEFKHNKGTVVSESGNHVEVKLKSGKVLKLPKSCIKLS